MKTLQTKNNKNIENELSIDIFNQMSLPVIICQLPDYRILHVNNAAVSLYGFSRDEFYDLFFTGLQESAFEFNDPLGYESGHDSGDYKIYQIHETKRHELLKVELISKKIIFKDLDALLVIVNEVTSKNSAHEKIKEYAAILESTDDAIIGKTFDGTITSWNKGAEQMYGYAAEEVIGRSVDIIIPPEKINEFRELMLKLQRGEKIEHLRTKRIKKDGTEIIISVTISPIVNSAGRLTGASAIARDITQKTLLEDMIYENSEKMKLALTAGRMGTWDWKFPNNTIEWDDYTYKIFGIGEGKFSGKFDDFLQLVHPEDREKVHNDIELTVENNVPFESEFKIISHDNNIRYLLFRGKLLKDITGQAFRLIGICLDITEKKKAELEKDKLLVIEKKLRKRADHLKRRLSFLAETSRILSSSLEYETTIKTVVKTVVPILADICVIDLIDDSGNIKTVEVVHSDPEKVKLLDEISAKYETSFDLIKKVVKSRNSIAIKKVDEKYLKHIAKDNEHLSALLRLDINSALIIPLKTKEKIYGAITLVMSESGRYYNKEDLILAEELAGRTATAIENVKLYISSKLTNIELEKRVKKRTEELELLNKELETFSYSVSHDLRTPLRAIQGFSNILVDEFSGSLNEEGRRLFKIIISNAARMGNLIDDLLSFSRMTKTKISNSEIDFNLMITEIFNEIKLSNEGQIIELKLDNLPPAFGDSSMLRQVWVNLITNAVKFSSKKNKSVIDIGSYKEKNETVYFIKDNGVGFDMQYADKLFGVFQRLHKTTEFEGTGVGLALIKKIITRHGGLIWTDAKLNEGAAFYFSLGNQNEQSK